MKPFRIRFTPETGKQISTLHPTNRRLIKTALKEIQKDPYSGDDLQGEFSGFKSYKPKRYRILYNIVEEERLIQVYYVGQRRDVYEQFRSLLTKLSS